MQATDEEGWVEFTNISSDGYSLQLAKVTGSVDQGYSATLNVPV